MEKTIIKAGIQSIVATILDYYSGRYGYPTALLFGFSNFVGTGAVGYLEYDEMNKNKDKSVSFLQARTLEIVSSIVISKIIDPFSWDNKGSNNFGWDVAEFDNMDKRIFIISISNVIAGTLTSWVIV